MSEPRQCTKCGKPFTGATTGLQFYWCRECVQGTIDPVRERMMDIERRARQADLADASAKERQDIQRELLGGCSAEAIHERMLEQARQQEEGVKNPDLWHGGQAQMRRENMAIVKRRYDAREKAQVEFDAMSPEEKERIWPMLQVSTDPPGTAKTVTTPFLPMPEPSGHNVRRSEATRPKDAESMTPVSSPSSIKQDTRPVSKTPVGMIPAEFVRPGPAEPHDPTTTHIDDTQPCRIEHDGWVVQARTPDELLHIVQQLAPLRHWLLPR